MEITLVGLRNNIVVRLSSCNTKQLTTVGKEVRKLTLHQESTEVRSAPPEAGRSYSFVSGKEASEIVQLYATGMSALAVAEEVGRPPRTVTDTLRKQGIEIRRTVPICEEIVSEMVALYGAGLSCAKIAITLGMSRSYVGKQLQQAGVVLRSKSEAAILRGKRSSSST